MRIILPELKGVEILNACLFMFALFKVGVGTLNVLFDLGFRAAAGC